MITIKEMPMIECNDTFLVAESLDGNRDAFRQIVERYKTLICSLAYSATGNLSRSEDIAQETFLAAWRQLRFLREPEKLRAWLCGIARRRIQKNFEHDGREPAHNAAPLENVQNSPAMAALPSEQATSREQEAILWRSLEKIPELYRDPLILYYRENQSIEQVSLALDLTEDAVKKRLSRGRKLLRDEVQTFVENTLHRTAPGQSFSVAVIAKLPLAAGPALGISAGAKGAAAAKSGLFSSWLVPLAPFLGIAAGVGAQWLIIHSTNADRNDRRRQIAITLIFWAVYLGLAVFGESTVYALGRHFEWSARTRFVSVISFWWLFLLASVAYLSVILQRAAISRRVRVAAGELLPQSLRQ
jgi:RNA polymerase sigma factor (sigma-70 family)